jgi:hypothetical protein
MTEDQVPEGTSTERLYYIRYDEDQWFRYDEAGHQFCYDTWIRKCEPIGVDAIVLQLIPDPLFPRDSERPMPYVAWRHAFDRKPKLGFTHEAIASFFLEDGVTLDVRVRAKIELLTCQYPNGTKYEIWNAEGKIVLTGKVNK